MANEPKYETRLVTADEGLEAVRYNVLIECNAMAELGYRLAATETVNSKIEEGALGLILVFELREK